MTKLQDLYLPETMVHCKSGVPDTWEERHIYETRRFDWVPKHWEIICPVLGTPLKWSYKFEGKPPLDDFVEVYYWYKKTGIDAVFFFCDYVFDIDWKNEGIFQFAIMSPYKELIEMYKEAGIGIEKN